MSKGSKKPPSALGRAWDSVKIEWLSLGQRMAGDKARVTHDLKVPMILQVIY